MEDLSFLPEGPEDHGARAVVAHPGDFLEGEDLPEEVVPPEAGDGL